jgi:sterol desaturase/sphingolipid hydroxylase (fatty acid hydroxylase superfamily)
MDHAPISSQKEPIRLFESDFLEFFTHIHPAVIVAIWLPVILFFLGRGVVLWQTPSVYWVVPLAYLLGIFIWTPTEYLMHRFVFHYRPHTPTGERIVFLFHGIHHAQPQDKTRLVMPPVVSVPLALVFYGLFRVLVGGLLRAPAWVDPMFAGFGTGYLAYDLIHYATHHFAMRSGALKYLKRYHMQHHYKTPDARFGVSSPLWDFVFGTNPG